MDAKLACFILLLFIASNEITYADNAYAKLKLSQDDCTSQEKCDLENVCESPCQCSSTTGVGYCYDTYDCTSQGACDEENVCESPCECSSTIEGHCYDQ